jgi:hypothetical protein
MKDLFTFQHDLVRQGMDLVELRLGSNKVRLYYHDVFTICSKLQGNATFALRYERNHPKLWAELNKYEREPIATPLHPTYRRSGLVSNVKVYKISFKGPLVILQFNELVAKFHYSDVPRLRAHLRRAAKQAKRWAGDDSQQWNIFARLTTAEDNDKFAYG